MELRDGSVVVLRPLVPADEDRLVALFADIPYEELRNLHDNVSEVAVARGWCRHIYYDRVLPIVAEIDGRIVADATLHRRRVGPMRDVGRLRAYVRPEYRRRGLGAVLLTELRELAKALGLTQVVVELFEDQVALRKMFLRYGFREEGRMPLYQTVILVREVARGEQAASA